MSGSRFPQAIQIGTSAFLTLAASVMLYVAGQLQVEREVNFVPTGNSTGAVIQVNGVTQKQIFTFPCTNTGGLAKYDTCIAQSPLTTSGSITSISVECGNVPKVYSYDVGFVSARNTGTGAGITNLNNKATATGSYAVYSTGSLVWNPANFLKLGTLTSVPTTSGNDCAMRVEMQDKYGS